MEKPSNVVSSWSVIRVKINKMVEINAVLWIFHVSVTNIEIKLMNNDKLLINLKSRKIQVYHQNMQFLFKYFALKLFFNKRKKIFKNDRSIKDTWICKSQFLEKRGKGRSKWRYFHFSRLPGDMSLKVGTDAGGSLKLSSARDIAAVYCMKYRGIPYFATA